MVSRADHPSPPHESSSTSVLVMVTGSPWGSSLAALALRFVRAALADGQRVTAVFFRDDGVHNLDPGGLSDGGIPPLEHSWRVLSEAHGFPLLRCSASVARRYDDASGRREDGVAGLGHWWKLVSECDRVVTF